MAIAAIGLVDTPADSVVSGVVVDPSVVGMALRSLLTTNGFTGKQAVLSVGGQSSLAVRVVDVPKMTDAELRRTMELDLERHLPFPLEGTVHDFVKISSPGASADESQMEVLLAAAQEQLIEGHVTVLDRAGLLPVAIDIEPLAICRSLVNLNGDGGPRTVAIVDMGHQLTEIAIVHDGFLRFVRSAPIAGEAFTNAIGQALVVETAQAEDLKRRYGTVFPDEGLEGEEAQQETLGPPADYRTPLDLPPAPAQEQAEDGLEFGGPPPLAEEAEEPTMPGLEDVSRRMGDYVAGRPSQEPEPAPAPQTEAASQPPPTEGPVEGQSDEDYTRHQISEALLGPLADLAREIHATLDYFSTRKSAQVERVLLTGGSSQIGNLAEFMTRELGVETVLGNPFAHLALSAPDASPELLSATAPLMAVCTGLAIRDLL